MFVLEREKLRRRQFGVNVSILIVSMASSQYLVDSILRPLTLNLLGSLKSVVRFGLAIIHKLFFRAWSIRHCKLPTKFAELVKQRTNMLGDMDLSLVPVMSLTLGDMDLSLVPVMSLTLGDKNLSLVPVMSLTLGDMDLSLVPVMSLTLGDKDFKSCSSHVTHSWGHGF